MTCHLTIICSITSCWLFVAKETAAAGRQRRWPHVTVAHLSGRCCRTTITLIIPRRTIANGKAVPPETGEITVDEVQKEPEKLVK